jgi:hypothetical protein
MSKDMKTPPSSNLKYYFIAAAVATGIAGMVHLYMPLIAAPRMLNSPLIALFFLGSGIAQIFWIIPMIKRWGRIWYYVGIAGNVAFILLYVITRFPDNPVNGRGGDIDIVAAICEMAQIGYIVITSVILAKERKSKISQSEYLK